MFMCGVLLHHNTAVRDRSIPNVGWRGGVHCSRVCSVFLHSEVKGHVIPKRQHTVSAIQPLILCIL